MAGLDDSKFVDKILQETSRIEEDTIQVTGYLKW